LRPRAEAQGQIAACNALNMALMAYGALGRGFLTKLTLRAETMAAGDIRARLPPFQAGNVEKNIALRSALEEFAQRRNATLAQFATAWTIARGEQAGTFIIPTVGAKSRRHLEENIKAAELQLAVEELAEIDRLVPFAAAAGTRYSADKMQRLNI